jgi:hypothetical protein
MTRLARQIPVGRASVGNVVSRVLPCPGALLVVDGGAAVSIAARAAGSAPGAARKAVRLWRLTGLVEPKWLHLDDPDGPGLTAKQVRDVEQFLVSAELRPLLSLLVAVRLAGEMSEVEGTLATQFRAEAKRWCTDSREGWDRQSAAIWQRLMDVLGFSLPSVERVAPLAENVNHFTRYVRSVLTTTSSSTVSEINGSRLVDLGSDLTRVAAAIELANTLAAHERERSMPPIMSHSDIENPPDFARLYVPRTLIDQATEAEVDSHDITSSEAPFRMVLLGNPGVGKSTFVRHLAHEFAFSQEADGSAGHACVLVRCREYLKAGSFREPIVDYVASAIQSAGISTARLEAITDALVLGRMSVIFDGLDEITQTAQRAEMVERIETFARAHPLASILVTSREVGYHRARVQSPSFRHASIREFSDSQVREYADRWFAAQGDDHLIEPFMRESESVLDLRTSPLLLSLLCVLYRARGTIPRRRLDVYSKCADLLFHTWDSHRSIAQPEELPKYGDRLMQEIARWVFDSPAAQEGIPESQVEKVITVYLGDMGIGRDEATRRAKDFLEFCAGRAWLLGSFGTTRHGERLFGFTHRTFFEYFTAEAVARRSRTAEDVRDHVLTAFDRDETSVLPELLIQAYDETQTQGGAEVFKLLCLGGKANAGLILRMMNGSLLSAHTRRMGFTKIVDGWRFDKRSVGMEAIDALFTLEPNAFEQFATEYVERPSEPHARTLLLHGWATSYLRHREHHSSGTVVATVERAKEQAVETFSLVDDLAVTNWLIAAGAMAVPAGMPMWSLLVVGTSSGNAPGAIPAAVTRWLYGRQDLGADNLCDLLGRWQATLCETPIPRSVAVQMLECVDPVLRSDVDPNALAEFRDYGDLDQAIASTLLVLTFLGIELGQRPEISWLQEVRAVRLAGLGEGPAVSPELGTDVARICRSLPEWARLWVLGRQSLLEERSQRPASAWSSPRQ